MSGEAKSSGKRYVLNASDVLEPVIGSDPATDGLAPETLWDILGRTVATHGDKVAYKACVQKQKDRDAGAYFTSSSEQLYTWNLFNSKCESFARALCTIGFEKFAAVNMIGFNSPEWVIADVGCMMAGGLAAGIYATNNAEACQYVSNHSKAQVVVVEGQKQLDKFKEIITKNIEGGLPALKALVAYNLSPEAVNDQKAECKAAGVDLYEFAEFLALGDTAEASDTAAAEVAARKAAQVAGNCCMLIYTSGTTGNPKAVMISHDNATWTGKMLSKHIDGLLQTDRVISYLPLSHIAAQILDVVGPILTGLTVTFARPDALKGSLPETLAAVRPTVFFGVPRVWEKIMAKIKAKGAETKGLKKTIATWAKGIGMGYSQAKQGCTNGKANYKTASSPCGYSCADCLVLSKIKNLLGLTECRVMMTGAAPISKEVLDFYAALDLPIMEVYGQSECTGPATCTSPAVGWKTGTVGPVIPGTTMRIDPNTQEIQYTGRHIFMGYMGMKQKSEDTLTDDGWLASGDQGAFDEDNFLSITGRIKELIIGAGGENVAPVVVEKVLKKHLDFLSNIVVFGDNQPYLGMFVSLEVVPDPETELPTDQLAPAVIKWCKSIGSDATTYSAAKTDEKINAAVEAGRKAAIASKSKGIISNASQPKFHIWLPEELTPHGEAATLTSTLKLKRNVVNKMYADVMAEGYKVQSAKFKKK